MNSHPPQEVVVADTTPLIALSESGFAWILKSLFDVIQVPDAVWQELEIGIDRPNRRTLLESPWLQRREVTPPTLSVSNLSQLDPGETEAISLALELQASLLLIDERAGRAAAAELNLEIIGTVGILLIAKQQGRISAVGPILEQMRRTSRFRLDGRFLAHVLRLAGEA